MAQNAQRVGGPSPKRAIGGAGAFLLLGGLVVAGNNALFNVDGGHRAIKYTRTGGVGKEIYSEGMTCPFEMSEQTVTDMPHLRHAFQNPMV